jgi:hypothetical protein
MAQPRRNSASATDELQRLRNTERELERVVHDVMECYLIALLIIGSRVLAAAVAAFLLLIFTVLWFVVPELDYMHAQRSRTRRRPRLAHAR